MKPTRESQHQSGPRPSRRDQLEQAEERGRRVADGDERAGEIGPPQLDRRRRARRREALGEFGHARVGDGGDDAVRRGKSALGDARGDHPCIDEDRRAGGERGAARRDRAGRGREIGDHAGIARRMGDPHR